jgi:hypothetical protein
MREVHKIIKIMGTLCLSAYSSSEITEPVDFVVSL